MKVNNLIIVTDTWSQVDPNNQNPVLVACELAGAGPPEPLWVELVSNSTENPQDDSSVWDPSSCNWGFADPPRIGLQTDISDWVSAGCSFVRMICFFLCVVVSSTDLFINSEVLFTKH